MTTSYQASAHANSGTQICGFAARTSRRAAICSALALVAGCTTVGPNFSPPAWLDEPQAYRNAEVSTPASAGGLRADWWTLFGDEGLSWLEELAAAHSNTLKATAARLLQARAQWAAGAAATLPAIRFGASAERLHTSGTTPQGAAFRGISIAGSQYTLGTSMSYEIDLWGRLRRIAESNQAQIDSSDAELDAARLMLSTQLASIYWQWRGVQVETELVARLLDVQDESRQLIVARFDAGLTTETEVSRAQVEHANIVIEHENLMRQVDELEHALCALAGQLPSSKLELPAVTVISLPSPPMIPVGVPALLLYRRPDLVGSLATLHAANARIGAAQADFFPSIELTGQYGFASNSLRNITDSDSRQFNIGPLSLRLPLFDGGRNQASLNLANARYAEAEADHRGKLLTALREVEDALSDNEHRAAQLSSVLVTQRETQRAVDVSLARSKQGLTNYLEVLNARRNALTADRNAAQIGTQRLVGSVALVRAIGGGWNGPGGN